jgi:hypothetical protein
MSMSLCVSDLNYSAKSSVVSLNNLSLDDPSEILYPLDFVSLEL